MKNEEITPKEYVENVEDELYKILEQNKYTRLPLPSPNSSEQQKNIFSVVISSILFKQAAYDAENNNKTNKQIATIFNIIFKINAIILTKNNEGIYKIFNDNAAEILKELKKYFKRKQQNYILKQLPLHIINSHKKIKDLLYYNPFMLQECFEYYCNPLTPEEQIIGEILELKSSLNNINPSSVVKNLLIQMIKKYGYEEFKTILIFIICNVYQNAIEVGNERMINSTKYCIENLQVSNQDIINWFIPRNGEYIEIKKELLDIIQTFLYHNERIKEGDLRNLEKQPSYQYVKERLKKPN